MRRENKFKINTFGKEKTTKTARVLTILVLALLLAVAGGANAQRKMYWTDAGTTNKIQRANPDGTGVEDLVAGLDDPKGIALVQETGELEDVGWWEKSKLIASEAVADDRFGGSVSIGGGYVIVGAAQHNEYSGSAYVFKRTSDLNNDNWVNSLDSGIAANQWLAGVE